MTAQRDPTVRLWPSSLVPANVTVKVDRAALTGAPVLSGRPQTVISSAGGWRMTYTDVGYTGRSYLALRALIAALAGSLEPIYVGPMIYNTFAPYVRAGLSRPSITGFTGGYTFTGGYGFASSTSDCTLAANVAAGATNITVTNSAQAPLSAGDWIELGGRLHTVKNITGTSWDIWPPTRAAYSSGDKVEIDDPRMLAYLDPAAAAINPDVQYGQVAQVSFEFIEARW